MRHLLFALTVLIPLSLPAAFGADKPSQNAEPSACDKVLDPRENLRATLRALTIRGWVDDTESHALIARLTDDERFELARVAIARSIFRFKELWRFSDARKAELVEIAMVSNRLNQVLPFVSEIDPKFLREAVKIEFMRDPINFFAQYPQLRIADEDRFEMLLSIAKTQPYLWGNLALMSGLTDEQRFAIAMEWAKIPASDVTLIPNFLLPVEEEFAVVREFMKKDPLPVVVHYGHQRIDADKPVFDPDGSIDLYRAFERFSQKYPKVLPRNWLELMWKPYTDKNLGLRLLKVAYQVSGSDVTYPFKSALEVALKGAGLSADASGIEVKGDTLRGLIDALTILTETLGLKPFEGISFDATLLAKKNRAALTEFCLNLSELLQFKKALGDFDSREFLEGLNLKKTGLVPEALPPLIEQLKTEIANEAQKAFSTKSSQIKISYDQYRALKESWGDLDPITTLITRYMANPQWSPELEILGRIFESSLKGEFENYKFHGDSADPRDQQMAQQQTNMTNGLQLEQWKLRRTRLAFAEGPARANEHGEHAENARVEAQKQALITELKKSLGEERSEEGDESARLVSGTELVRRITESRQAPEAMLSELLESSEMKQVRGAVLRALEARPLSDAEWIRLELFFKILLNQGAWGYPKAKARAALPQLDALYKLAKAQATSRVPDGSLIFTTTLKDPKGLIMVGTLGSPTCQDFRTGSFAEMLLGNVIDAHSQAILTYELTSRSFESPADFTALKAALARNTEIKRDFDGNRFIAKFSFQDENGKQVEIQTQSMPQATSRRLIRLGQGQTTNSPAIAVETVYEVGPQHRDQREKEVAALLTEMKNAVGDQGDRALTVMSTRNPLGTVSDFGGKTRTGYVVNR